MLTSLQIKNFRTFAELNIERLGRVNLIVGKNNVGKTTLLEALRLYGSVCPAETAKSILRGRNEIFSTAGGETLLALPSLFYQHRMSESSEARIGELDEPVCCLRTVFSMPSGSAGSTSAPYSSASGSTGSTSAPYSSVSGSTSNTPSVEIESRLRVETLNADGSVVRAIRLPYDFETHNCGEPPCLHGPCGKKDMEDVTSQWWDAISLTDGEDRVCKSMRIIAPVRGVAFVGKPGDDFGRFAKTRLDEADTPVPLASLGDGVVRLFQIAVAMEYALVHCKAMERMGAEAACHLPLLLIDEIDVGIHHTLLAKLWEFILKTSRRLGVQVFATTHSWDCLKGLAQAIMEDDQDDDCFAIRLERDEDEEATRAIVIDQTKLPIVLRDTIEVR